MESVALYICFYQSYAHVVLILDPLKSFQCRASYSFYFLVHKLSIASLIMQYSQRFSLCVVIQNMRFFIEASQRLVRLWRKRETGLEPATLSLEN